jgi:hypothetical protein
MHLILRWNMPSPPTSEKSLGIPREYFTDSYVFNWRNLLILPIAVSWRIPYRAALPNQPDLPILYFSCRLGSFDDSRQLLRRLLSVLLLAVFGLPVVSPFFAMSTTDVARLPACCRREGKHHCTMLQSYTMGLEKNGAIAILKE